MATVVFYECACGITVADTHPAKTAPTCVCGRAMTEMTDTVPAANMTSAKVARQDQRNR